MSEMSLGKILIEFGVELGELQKGLAEVKESVKQTGEETQRQGQSSLSDYAQKWFFVKAAIMDVANFMKGMMVEYANQERAINSLNLALGNQGNLLPGVSAALQEQASALQRTTTFADEAITKGQSFLAMAGMTGDQIKAATPAILDYAAATGKDVTTAFMDAMRGAEGMDRAFRLYGISVDDNLPKSERLAQLTDQLSGKFGGMSQVIAGDAIGRMEMLNNAMGEVKEGMGKLFQFMTESTLGGGAQAVAFFERLGKFFSEDLIIYLGMARQGFANMVAGILEGAAGIGTAVNTIAGWFGSTFGAEQVESLKLWAQGFRDAGQAIYDEAVAAATAAPGNQELQSRMEGLAGSITDKVVPASQLAIQHLSTWNAMQAQYRTELAASQAASAEHAAILADIMSGITNDTVIPFIDGYNMAGGLKQAQDAAMAASARRLGVEMKSESATTLAQLRKDYESLSAAGQLSTSQREAAEKKLLEAEKKMQEEKKSFVQSTNFQILQSTLGVLSQLGTVGKMFAIAEATMNVLVGLTAALRTPWPANIVAFAQVAAMGWGVVSRIKGLSFAEGTPGLDFANFGNEMPALLHGSEAVIPKGGGHALAGEIAKSLATMPSGMGSVSAVGGGANGGGGEIVVQNHVQAMLTLDGKVLGEAIEELTKTGRARIHPTAVKEF